MITDGMILGALGILTLYGCVQALFVYLRAHEDHAGPM